MTTDEFARYADECAAPDAGCRAVADLVAPADPIGFGGRLKKFMARQKMLCTLYTSLCTKYT